MREHDAETPARGRGPRTTHARAGAHRSAAPRRKPRLGARLLRLLGLGLYQLADLYEDLRNLPASFLATIDAIEERERDLEGDRPDAIRVRARVRSVDGSPGYEGRAFDDGALHPSGRCRCAGEGRCDWCVDTERREAERAARGEVCPCETDVEDPGPHIDSCPWSDPDYDDGYGDGPHAPLPGDPVGGAT